MFTQPKAIALITQPSRQQQIAALLPEYAWVWDLPLKGAIHRAADLRPAVVLVEMDQAEAGWVEVLLALQTSPATRRIPLIGLAAAFSPELHAQAAKIGVAALLAWAEVEDRLKKVLAEHARVWDETYYHSMQSACEEPLPEIAREGLRLFDAHDFWEAHEVLEQAWIAEARPVRDLYRAILQVGVAYYQIQKGNQRGAIKMFLRAVQWLDPLPEVCHGIDVAQFRRDATAVRSALAALPPENISQFDQRLFKPIPFIQK